MQSEITYTFKKIKNGYLVTYTDVVKGDSITEFCPFDGLNKVFDAIRHNIIMIQES